jgi:hypothetical protein
MKYFYFTFVALIFGLPLFGQTPDDQRKELFQGFGLCRGQEIHLDYIQEAYPKLKPNVMIARLKFSGFFGKSCDFLQSLIADDIQTALDKTFKSQFDLFKSKSEGEALNFIKLVQDRANGQIDSPFKEALLANNPAILEQPEIEFLKGFTTAFNTKGHSKAKGLDLTIKLPFSWIRREGNRPNIIQFFKARNSEEGASLSIMVQDLDLFRGRKMTDREARKLFEPIAIKEFSAGGKIVESTQIVLEGQPGVVTVEDATFERLNLKGESRIVNYVVFYDQKLIFISAAVYSSQGTDNKIKAYNKYRPVFDLIANSLIINNKYQ